MYFNYAFPTRDIKLILPGIENCHVWNKHKFYWHIEKKFFYCSSTVVSIFNPPWSPTPPIPTSHPRTYPLWLCTCVLYTCSLMDLPLFSPIIPLPPTPLVTVSLFFISMFCLLIFCLLICFVD